MTTYYFHNIDNSHALGYSVILAILCVGCIIRALYWAAEENKEHYPTTAVYLAVIGKRWISRLSFISVVMVALLSFRITQTYRSTSSFWSLDAVSVGWWCVIRIILVSLASLATTLFDSSAFFRCWCIVVYPVAVVLDMFSQISLVVQLNCLSTGSCVNLESQYNTLNLCCWRDLGGIVCNLTVFGVIIWLAACYGFGASTVYLPPMEHRMLSKRLDQLQVTKPKVRRELVHRTNYY